MDHPVRWYDFTLSFTDVIFDPLRDWLRRNCRDFSFSKERGLITGYLHLQGRLVLKTKQRLAAMISDAPREIASWHLSKTSNNCIGKLDPMSYTKKDYTHEEGPWTMASESLPPDMLSPVLRDWQRHLLRTLDADPDSRHIWYAADQSGGAGKTWMCRYLIANRDALLIPYNGNVEMMANSLGSTHPRRIYLIDIPRCDSRQNWRKLVCFAEAVKNGIVTEMRYHFRQTLIPIPHIVIFCNFDLDRSWLSSDRWRRVDTSFVPCPF